jgi:hypothetical protein
MTIHEDRTPNVPGSQPQDQYGIWAQTAPIGSPEAGPPPAPKKRRLWPILFAAVGLFVLIATIIGITLGSQSGTPHVSTPTGYSAEDQQRQLDETPAAATTTEPTAAPTATKATRAVSVEEQNAIQAAKDYLDYSAFSRKGLIEQLAYEGYSTKVAARAVDSLHVDWKEQAVGSAKEYLSGQSFSRRGLIEQLEYEGFSHTQAVYGVTKAGL